MVVQTVVLICYQSSPLVTLCYCTVNEAVVVTTFCVICIYVTLPQCCCNLTTVFCVMLLQQCTIKILYPGCVHELLPVSLSNCRVLQFINSPK